MADGLALLLHEKTTDCTKLVSDTQAWEHPSTPTEYPLGVPRNNTSGPPYVSEQVVCVRACVRACVRVRATALAFVQRMIEFCDANLPLGERPLG